MPRASYFSNMSLSGLKTGRDALSPKVDSAKEIALNQAFPIAIPGINDLIDLYIRGMIDAEELTHFARANGVPILGGQIAGSIPRNEYLWNRLIDAAKELPPADAIWRLALASGDPSRKLWYDFVKRSGGDEKWWRIAAPAMWERPNISDATAAFVRGLLTPEQFGSALLLNGADQKEWREQTAISFDWPDNTLLAEAVRRGHITERQWLDMIQHSALPFEFWKGADGLVFPFKRADADVPFWRPSRTLTEMIYYLPSPGDLVTFAVKDVFDPQVANLFRLFDDYPTAVDKWAEKLGMTQPLHIHANVNGVPTDLHWMHLQWGSHWRNLGAGQFFEFLHRIRADNVDKLRKRGFKVDPFTLPLVNLGLKTDDYPPQWRDYLTAVSYRPIEARRVQQGLFHGVMNRKDAEEAWMDRGYHPEDAQRMTDVAIAQNQYIKDGPRRALVTRLISESLREILASYETGVVSRSVALESVKLVLFDKDAAEGQLRIIDNRIVRQLAEQAIKSIRSDWMQGTLSEIELTGALTEAGIQPDAIGRYVQLWTLERGHRRRAASSGQILQWVAKGLMTEAEAARRLNNLGWFGPDVAVMLADSQHKLSQLQAREEQQVATSAAKQARALAKMQKETAALQKELQSKLRMSEPVSRLIKWTKAGIIDVPQLRVRLQAIGILPQMVSQYVAETVKEMEQAAEKADEAALKKSQSATHHAPVSTLRKWFKLGIISEDQFRSMAASIKTSQSDIDNYVTQTNMGK